MAKRDWQFFVSGKHTRSRRLWQSFFAGWGLFFTIALIASPFVFRNITWTLLDTVDLEGIKQNNLSIDNLKLNGTSQNGEHFHIETKRALQTYQNPNTVHFQKPIADITRIKDGEKIRDHIISDEGRLLLEDRKVILTGNVSIASSDGSTTKTNEIEVKLK